MNTSPGVTVKQEVEANTVIVNEDVISHGSPSSGDAAVGDSSAPPNTGLQPPIFPNFPTIQLNQGLPIHEFYRQFPWLYKRGAGGSNALGQPSSYEPGRRGRKVQFPQVEKVLYERLLQRQRGGQRVSNRWLQVSAQCC